MIVADNWAVAVMPWIQSREYGYGQDGVPWGTPYQVASDIAVRLTAAYPWQYRIMPGQLVQGLLV